MSDYYYKQRLKQQREKAKQEAQRLLKRICNQEQQNEMLTQIVLDCFRPDEQKFFEHCGLHQHIVIITVNTQTFLSRLRTKLPQITQKLKTHPQFHHIRKVRMRLLRGRDMGYAAQSRLDPTRQAVFSPKFSNRSAKVIANSAKELDDGDLKEKLLALAQCVLSSKVV